MFDVLRKWLHDEVAEPIAQGFAELEARLRRVEVELGLREADGGVKADVVEVPAPASTVEGSPAPVSGDTTSAPPAA